MKHSDEEAISFLTALPLSAAVSTWEQQPFAPTWLSRHVRRSTLRKPAGLESIPKSHLGMLS